MRRLESTVTTTPVAALKVAVASYPAAMVFASQFAASLQFPFYRDVQVPFAPETTRVPVPVK